MDDALRAEGCEVFAPRYPLLHEQPFFTEGQFKKILRINNEDSPTYLAGGFQKTRHMNNSLIKFPCFTTSNQLALNQYIKAINKIGNNQDLIIKNLEK